DRSDGRARAMVEQRGPRLARIVGTPYTAARGAEVEAVRLARHALNHLRPAGAERAEKTPVQRGIERRIDGRGGGGAAPKSDGRKQQPGNGLADADHGC